MPKKMKHQVQKPVKPARLKKAAWTTGSLLAILLSGVLVGALIFEFRYRGRVYPNVYIGGVLFGGKYKEDVSGYWRSKSLPFEDVSFEFRAGDLVATVSGQELNLGYDAELSATQAYLIGRSGNMLSDFGLKFLSGRTELTPMFRYETGIVDQIIDTFAQSLYIPPQEALFNFSGGRVTAFKPSLSGRRLNTEKARNDFSKLLSELPAQPIQKLITISLPVETVHAKITTDSVNNLGINELIGTGYSEFSGSIPGRIHNVALAAARFNGVLIPPGQTISFNQTLGDVSASTGYRQAYIIQNGRTILGDGGGVCQVSTTLFRAALNSGLPVVERAPHAYRVHYYEEGGFKPGLDATVFSPSVDLKLTNNTGHHILIQTKTDTKNLTLTFELYGSRDGRTAVVTNHKVWGITPPPEPLYQDDPTLAAGTIKQVDWAAWGAKSSFDYKVTKDGKILEEKTFYSTYRPWQAVYLKGTLVQ